MSSYFLYRRRSSRRETWGFKKDGTQIKEIPQRHIDRIKKLCRTGLTWGEIQANENWDYLARYDGDVAYGYCKEAIGERDKVLREGTRLTDASQCSSGKLCPSETMGVLFPCANRDGTKCCDINTKNCKPVTFAQKADAARSAGGQRYRKDTLPGQENNRQAKYRDCAYFTRSQLVVDGKGWECTNGEAGTAKLYDTGVQDKHRTTPWWAYQCAQSQKCADLVKKDRDGTEQTPKPAPKPAPQTPEVARYWDTDRKVSLGRGGQSTGQDDGLLACPGRPEERGAALFFTDAMFGGRCLALPQGNFPYVGDNGFNDSITSVQLAKGYIAKLYQHGHFNTFERGRVTTLDPQTAGVYRFGNIGVTDDMNDMASSVQVCKRDDPDCQQNQCIGGGNLCDPNFRPSKPWWKKLLNVVAPVTNFIPNF